MEKEKDAKDDSGALAWWKDVAMKKSDNMTPKEKLFKTDYQIYQAFGYLKTWKTLKNLQK